MKCNLNGRSKLRTIPRRKKGKIYSRKYSGKTPLPCPCPKTETLFSLKHILLSFTHTVFHNSVCQIRTHDINPFHIQNSHFWEISIQKVNADNTGSFLYTIYNLLSPLFYNLQPSGTVRMAASKAF
jgi:hypothetical protein